MNDDSSFDIYDGNAADGLCPRCDGYGHYTDRIQIGEFSHEVIEAYCFTCHGTGTTKLKYRVSREDKFRIALGLFRTYIRFWGDVNDSPTFDYWLEEGIKECEEEKPCSDPWHTNQTGQPEHHCPTCGK